MDMPITRECRVCRAVKPLADFANDATCDHGKRHTCRECFRFSQRDRHARMKADPSYRAKLVEARRTHDLKRRYWISPAEYERMHAAQGGRCLICDREQGGKRLAVDHCHATGRVRGLLCTACNHGLGKFRDSPTLLESAAAYLRRLSD